MKQPKNVEDLTQCVKTVANQLYIYCTECEGWRPVAVHSRSNVLLLQSGYVKLLDTDQILFVCKACRADVEYLLTPAHKAQVNNRIVAL
jgi:hypothetical protein